MPLFLATRAGVRAVVAGDRAKEMEEKAAQADKSEAQDYFDRARAFLVPAPAGLVAVGGLSGSGKSTLGRSLAAMIEPPPGAIHIRSDIERKALLGVGETERLEPEYYSQEASTRVYEAMLSRASHALAAGYSVVLDAVFSTSEERSNAERLAAAHGVHFQGLWLEASPSILKKRVSSRLDDASDATAEVVEQQFAYDVGKVTWKRLDASSCAETTLQRAMRVILSRNLGLVGRVATRNVQPCV
jgi:predicted kinase